MAFKRFFLAAAILVVSLAAQAQKVKYKDIYVWLANKQYTEAEPFLKRYLKDNDDNPNAFLFMGLIFEQKGSKNDVLKEAGISITNMDSTLIFLDKAYKLMTEKELKRNDEYYESFKRRDLRTGEYGVKLSDIQFFIEKKQQEMRERTDKVKLVKHYFSLSDTLYIKSQLLFASIQEKHGTTKSLLLIADEATIDNLENLSSRFDSCTKAFDIYRTNLQSLGKTGYNQQIDLLNITDIATDGLTKADFYADKLSLWDYKEFADKKVKTIKDDVMPLRDHLVSSDIDINRLREKMERDSVSVTDEIQKLKGKLQNNLLLKFDDAPLPTFVFDTKIADIEYRSLLLEHKPLADSADVHLKLKLAKQEYASVKKLDSLSAMVNTDFIDGKSEYYEHFISNTYNSAAVLKSYMKGVKDYAQRERSLKEFEVNFRQKGLQWLLTGADSVALFKEPGIRYTNQPLSIIEEKYTSGLVYKDSLNATGYFYSITPSRKPDISTTFPVEKGLYSRSKLPKSKSIIVSDPAGQIFFVVIYSENKIKEKTPVTVAKIYRSDGLAWSTNLQLSMVPSTGTFANGELSLTSAEGQSLVIDKNGKIK
jgi:hypothetical protein